MHQHFIRLSLAAFALILLVAAPVMAHHGWGGQAEQESTLTGTVEAPVSLAGPHGAMKIKTSDGQVWDITLAPSNRTAGAGLKEGVLPLGATVTVRGHRNKTANRFEMKTEAVTWNNKTFTVYPNQH